MGSKSTPPPSYVNYADLEVLATTATADELGLEFFKKFHVLRAYTVEWGKKRLRLAAGIAHGIRKNARFTLYQNIEALRDGSKPLGQTKESEIGAFSTLLLPLHNMSSDFPASCIAIQTESSDPEGLRVHAPAEILHLPLFKEIASSFSGKGINDPCRIKLVDKAEAQLEIVPAGGSQVTFNVLDEFSTNCGFTRLPHVVDLYDGSLGRILCSAARYYLQLNIQHTSYPEPLEKPKVELFLLKEQCGEDDEVVLIPGEEYMYRGAMIEIEVDEETKYGIKIWNHEDVDLGLVCFYFDHANLSITSLTDVPEHYQTLHPLKARSNLEIGYGDSVIPPFGFNEAPPGLDLTLGFFKFVFFHLPEFTGERPILLTLRIPVVQRRKNFTR